MKPFRAMSKPDASSSSIDSSLVSSLYASTNISHEED